MSATFWVVTMLLASVGAQCWGVATLAAANRRQSAAIVRLAEATGTFVEVVERLLVRGDRTPPAKGDRPG